MNKEPSERKISGKAPLELPDEMLDGVAGGMTSEFIDEWMDRTDELEWEWGVTISDTAGQKRAEDQAYNEIWQKYYGNNG